MVSWRDLNAVATESPVGVGQLTHLLEQSARFATELIVLFGENRLEGVDQGVDLNGSVVVVLWRGRASNSLGKYLVKSQFHVGVVGEVVVVLRNRGKDRRLLVDFIIGVNFVVLDHGIFFHNDVQIAVVAVVDDIDV